MTREEYLQGIRPMIDAIKSSAALYYKIAERPLGVTGEMAEFEAIDKLDLHPATARKDGYDAIRKVKGKEYFVQIKGRVIQPGPKKSQRVGTLKPENNNWNSVVLVLMNENFETTEMWEAQRDELVKFIAESNSRAVKERGQLSVNAFKRLAGKRIWPE